MDVLDRQRDLYHRDVCDVFLRGRGLLRHGHGVSVSLLGV